MGFIKFWLFSTLFFLTFPLSIIFCLLFFGFNETKQFVVVLIKDYMQTMLIVFILCISGLTFVIYYIVSLFN